MKRFAWMIPNLCIIFTACVLYSCVTALLRGQPEATFSCITLLQIIGYLIGTMVLFTLLERVEFGHRLTYTLTVAAAQYILFLTVGLLARWMAPRWTSLFWSSLQWAMLYSLLQLYFHWRQRQATQEINRRLERERQARQ